MSRLLPLSLVLVPLIATVAIAQNQPGNAVKGSPADAAAIKQLADQYAAGWNEGNAKNATSIFTDNAVVVNDQGKEERGRPAIEKELEGTLRGELRGTSFKATVDGVRFVKPDVAIAYGTSQVEGAPTSPTNGHFLATCEKMGNAWKVVGLGTGIDATH